MCAIPIGNGYRSIDSPEQLLYVIARIFHCCSFCLFRPDWNPINQIILFATSTINQRKLKELRLADTLNSFGDFFFFLFSVNGCLFATATINLSMYRAILNMHLHIFLPSVYQRRNPVEYPSGWSLFPSGRVGFQSGAKSLYQIIIFFAKNQKHIFHLQSISSVNIHHKRDSTRTAKTKLPSGGNVLFLGAHARNFTILGGLLPTSTYR